ARSNDASRGVDRTFGTSGVARRTDKGARGVEGFVINGSSRTSADPNSGKRPADPVNSEGGLSVGVGSDRARAGLDRARSASGPSGSSPSRKRSSGVGRASFREKSYPQWQHRSRRSNPR